MKALFNSIISWANNRNIIKGSTAQKQFPKLLEEVIELYATLHPWKDGTVIMGSLIRIICELDEKGKIKQAPKGKLITDDVGDCMVVLAIMAEQEKLTVTECLEHAYNDIKDRKGQMIDGVFVKEGG
ncbi:MAG TPA: hypothetical protein EYN67_20455 [Flavobacteriales bacterium]|nr:hypothetical protein [Flavobacteriales bacterium]